MINLSEIKNGNWLENTNQNLNITQKFLDDFLSKNEKNKTEMRVLEFSNYIDLLEREKLSGKDGYYSKFGLEAMSDDKANAKKVFKEILDLVNEKQTELKLKEGYGLKIAEATKTKKLNTILKGIIAHEMHQTLNWELNVIEEAKTNAISKGVLYRDNDEDMLVALQNGRTVILYKGKLLNSKIDEIKAELKLFESDFYANLIMAYVKEKSSKTKVFFNKNKDKLMQDAKNKLEKIVDELEKNCIIDEVSTSLFNLYSNDKKTLEHEIEKQKKYKDEIKNKVFCLINSKNKKEESLQDEILKDFFEIIQNKKKDDNLVDVKDIPLGLNLENQLEAEKYVENINKKGYIETNEIIFLDAFEKLKNPEDFKQLKLHKYKFNLSKEDFKLFFGYQKEKNATIKDNFELLKEATKKIKNTEDKVNLIRNILNDFEEAKISKEKPLSFEDKQKIAKIRINVN